MIDTLKGKYYIRCNTCNSTAGAFGSFGDAVTYAKQNGWRLVKTGGGEMLNYCPSCVKRHRRKEKRY